MSEFVIVTYPGKARRFSLARARIGGGYAIVAEFRDEGLLQEVTDLLNGRRREGKEPKRFWRAA